MTYPTHLTCPRYLPRPPDLFHATYPTHPTYLTHLTLSCSSPSGPRP
jgi:hypothetical protein